MLVLLLLFQNGDINHRGCTGQHSPYQWQKDVISHMAMMPIPHSGSNCAPIILSGLLEAASLPFMMFSH
jgi:hypothetical protein